MFESRNRFYKRPILSVLLCSLWKANCAFRSCIQRLYRNIASFAHAANLRMSKFGWAGVSWKPYALVCAHKRMPGTVISLFLTGRICTYIRISVSQSDFGFFLIALVSNVIIENLQILLFWWTYIKCNHKHCCSVARENLLFWTLIVHVRRP